MTIGWVGESENKRGKGHFYLCTYIFNLDSVSVFCHSCFLFSDYFLLLSKNKLFLLFVVLLFFLSSLNYFAAGGDG